MTIRGRRTRRRWLQASIYAAAVVTITTLQALVVGAIVAVLVFIGLMLFT